MSIPLPDTPEDRAARRGDWPVSRFRLGEEPGDDLSDMTRAPERLAMMWPLAESGWKIAGRELPTYDRSNIPSRLFPQALAVPTTMTIDGLNEDFRDILVLFADANVEFVVVGAYALAFHGAPRFSGDIDLFVRAEPENAARVFAALARFGAPLASVGVTADDFARPGTVYQIGLPPRRIDIITEISGVAFDDAWATRETALVENRPVHFIGRDEFLRNKEAAGRPKDLADVARLKKLPPKVRP